MVNLTIPSRYKIDRKKIKNAAQVLVNSAGFVETDILNIVFVGKNKMRKIAKEYKKEDVALPVLSFKYAQTMSNNEKLIAEIFICYPQAILLAAEREKRVEDIIVSLIEHGIENVI